MIILEVARIRSATNTARERLGLRTRSYEKVPQGAELSEMSSTK
jgi:hypothetical protein